MRHVVAAASILTMIFVIPLLSLAGTFRDDFENEQDFLADKKVRVGGVWGEDISRYKWEEGSIKGVDAGDAAWFLVTGDYGWSDYTIECKIKLLQVNIHAGLALRRPCMDCWGGYGFVFAAPNQAGIWSYQGQRKLLESSPLEIEMDRWYSIKAIAVGNDLEFYVDGNMLAKVNDSTFRTGKAGLFVVGSAAFFDDFVMTGPEVVDGGHWNPEIHAQSMSDKPQSKLTISWGAIRMGLK